MSGSVDTEGRHNVSYNVKMIIKVKSSVGGGGIAMRRHNNGGR